MEQEREYVVYAHINKINNKKYIGITKMKPISKRWGHNGNKYKGCVYFWNAIKKYGWDNFTHEILLDNLTYEEACEKEKELIEKYDTRNREKGYNLAIGGQGPTKESLEEMRLAHLNKHLSEEHKRKISEGVGQGINNINYGRKQTDLAKKHNSEAKSGQNHPNWGKHRKEETKKKISQSNSQPIYQCDLDNNIIKKFNNCYEAAEFYHISKSGINFATNGKRKTIIGCKWYKVKEFPFKDKEKEFLDKNNQME